MADLLIRNFPEAELRLLDEQARQLGLSRAEHVRRQLLREARRTAEPVTVDDLVASSELLADIADERLMADAWS